MDLSFNATILAQIFHFVLLLVLLRLVVYRPLLKILEDRQKHIAGSIAAAEQEKTEAEKYKADLEAELKRAREQAVEIVQQATKSAESQAQDIISAAKAEANRVKEDALQEIQREREKSVAQLREEAASLAVLVAGKIVGRSITPEVQQSLVKEFIDEAGGLLC